MALLTALGIEAGTEPLLRKADAWPPEKIAAVKMQRALAGTAIQPGGLAGADRSDHPDQVLAVRPSKPSAAWLTARAQLAARLEVATGRLALSTPSWPRSPGLSPRPVPMLAHPDGRSAPARLGLGYKTAARVGALLQGLVDALRRGAWPAGTGRHSACRRRAHGPAARGSAGAEPARRLRHPEPRLAARGHHRGRRGGQSGLSGRVPGRHPRQAARSLRRRLPILRGSINGQVFIWPDAPRSGMNSVGRMSGPARLNEGRLGQVRARRRLRGSGRAHGE
ncbi:MAG: hypothetical protein MZV65_32110 [Chromatiales bacterium]|nr:hypothetical protein [Chromatiales bacterium]